MARYRFLILDVFSAEPFGGNQLAVLPDARGISDEGLQLIAREFNFPESTFVLPPTTPDAVRRVRIFTPRRELPFAGHPTVGTACVLVAEGMAADGSFIIEEKIGPVAVVTQSGNGRPFATLTVHQSPAVHPGHADNDAVAAAITLEASDVVRIFAASLGLDFTFVQLADRETVDRAALDHGALARAFDGRDDGQLYLFAGDLADGGEIYARLFAPDFGIAEDPATGSAASTLVGAAALLTRAGDGSFSLAIRQGVSMGRPSELAASATVRDGAVASVSVGGAAAFVAEGEIDVPERYLLG